MFQCAHFGATCVFLLFTGLSVAIVLTKFSRDDTRLRFEQSVGALDSQLFVPKVELLRLRLFDYDTLNIKKNARFCV